jgi:hypothetical protein
MPARNSQQHTTKLQTAAARPLDAPAQLAREQARAARSRLWDLALHLQRAGALETPDLNRIKHALKGARGSRATPDALRSATRACVALAGELAGRHPSPLVPPCGRSSRGAAHSLPAAAPARQPFAAEFDGRRRRTSPPQAGRSTKRRSQA